MSRMTILSVSLAMMIACAGPQSPPGGDDAGQQAGYGDGSAPCVAELPPAQRTAAIAAWVDGSLPAKVDGTEPCDFYDFAWRSFLGLTAPQGDGYVFTHWGSADQLFPADGAPPPFPSGDAPPLVAGPKLGKHAAAAIADPDAITADDVGQAASLVPLTDQLGRWVHYNILYNQVEYDFIRSQGLYATECYDAWGGTEAGEVTYDPATKTVSVTCIAGGNKTEHTCATGVTPDPMPKMRAGAVALKVAWRVLETCDLPDSPQPCTPEDQSLYLTVPGTVSPYSPTVSEKAVTLGLVGLHIVTRTASFPDGVWATFEHRANDADCAPATPPVGKAWSLQGTGEENMFCTPCPFALDQWPESFQKIAHQQAEDAQAILVDDGTRLVCTSNPGAFNLAHPALYDPSTCTGDPIPTEVCREVPIPEAVATLNSIVDPVLANDAPALANYQLVGVLWLNEDCRENAGCAEQGTLKLTNTTMETFEQGLDESQFNAGTGCLVCHGTNAFNPNPYTVKPYAQGIADRSFAFFRIQQKKGASCTAPPASYTCPPCAAGQQASLLAAH